MKKIGDVFKKFKKELVATEVTVFPATEEGARDAENYARQLEKAKKKTSIITARDWDGNCVFKVTLYEKKRLAH